MNWLSTGLSTASLLISCYALGLALQVRNECERVRAASVQFSERLQTLTGSVEQSGPAKLAAQLDALEAAIVVDRAALKSQLGKIWGRIGRERESVIEGQADDPEFQNLIQLQRQFTNGGT